MNIKYLFKYCSSSEFLRIYQTSLRVSKYLTQAAGRASQCKSIQIKYINNDHLLQKCKIQCNSDLSHGDDCDDESITSRVILRVGHFAGGTEGSLSQRITSPYLSHQPTLAPLICDIFSHFILF